MVEHFNWYCYVVSNFLEKVIKNELTVDYFSKGLLYYGRDGAKTNRLFDLIKLEHQKYFTQVGQTFRAGHKRHKCCLVPQWSIAVQLK